MDSNPNGTGAVDPRRSLLEGRWLYPAIFALALVVRAGYLAELRGSPLTAVPMGDGEIYDAWARRIAGGAWYGTEVFYQAPLYPYALALVYRLLGPDPWTMRAVQALLDSGSCVLLTAAGRRFFPPAVGAVAGVVLALYGPQVFFCGLLQKPVLDVFLTTLLLLILGQALRAPRAPLLTAAGATVGLLSLSRENALVLAPLVPLWVLLQFRGSPPARRLAWASAAVVGLALVLLPVGLRNRRIGGEFLITTSQMGPNFYIGNGAAADGTYEPLLPGRAHPDVERADAKELAEKALGRTLAPGEVSRYWLGRAASEIGARPGRWVRLLARKWVMVWNAREYMDYESIEAFSEWSRVLRTLRAVVGFGVVAPLACAGLWLTRGRWRELWVLYAAAFGVAASIVAFYIMARYRTPLVPVVILFAAAGGVGFFAAGRAGRRGAAACALAGAVFVNWPLSLGYSPEAITDSNASIDLLNAARDAAARGDRASAAGFYRQSKDMMERVLPLVPSGSAAAAEAHRQLGTILRELGQLPESLEHYRRALAVDPRVWELQDQAAEVLVELGRLGEAIRHWKAAVRLSPNDPVLRAELAEALLASGRAGEAVEEARAALALRPDWPEGRLLLRRALAASQGPRPALSPR